MDIFVFAVSTVTEESVMIPRHLLVLINPAGGKGKAVNDFKQHVQPLFDLAEINYNVVITGKYMQRKLGILIRCKVNNSKEKKLVATLVLDTKMSQITVQVKMTGSTHTFPW